MQVCRKWKVSRVMETDSYWAGRSAMDSIFATLLCYLLAFSFALAQTNEDNLTVPPTMTNSDLNLTQNTETVTPSDTTVHVNATLNLTENTTPFTSTTQDGTTFTETTTATTESTSDHQTSQSTTIMTTSTKSLSTVTKTPSTISTFTTMTTVEMQTTEGHTDSSETTVFITANTTQTSNTTSESLNRTTKALSLNISEKNMTIIFSVLLGLFAMALVAFMFHQCKQKIQYLHQPLNNTNDMDAFVADDDTLVISGGLYDGHPIYDNIPTADQSQFRLEFLY